MYAVQYDVDTSEQNIFLCSPSPVTGMWYHHQLKNTAVIHHYEDVVIDLYWRYWNYWINGGGVGYARSGRLIHAILCPTAK